LEKTLITNTPATIRPMPTMAGGSSRCLNNTQAMMVISTMPTPDQIA
jgi:hypothetical protein